MKILPLIIALALTGQVENLNNRGVEHLKAGRLDEAVVCFTQYLEENPDSFSAQYNLGITYVKMKKWDQARIALEQACLQRPEHINAHYQLAYTLYQLEMFSFAIERLAKILEQDPDHENAHMLQGLCYLNIGDEKKAEVSLENVLRLDPNKRNVVVKLANLKEKQTRWQEAVTYYQKAIDILPDKHLYYNMGLILYTLEKVDEAKAAMQKALEMDPDYDKAQEFLDHFKKPQPLPPLPELKTMKEIRDHYGKPDKIIKAESGGGNYEVWYYYDEKVVCSFLFGKIWEFRRYYRLKEDN